MVHYLKVWLLLSVLAIAGLDTVTALRTLAQETSITAACDPDEPLKGQVIMSLEQARSALDARNRKEIPILALQEGLSLASQLRSSWIQPNLIQEWLLNDNEGYSASRFQRLMQQAELRKQGAQVRLVLDQFLHLTNRLTTGTSFVKTRALAAIARHYLALKQPQQAEIVLTQARQASRFIRGPIFSASAGMDIAEGYATITQPQITKEILAQVEQALQQVPLNTSEPIKVIILERMAATYASVGDFAKAEQIAARLPKNSEAQSIALRGIAQAYITAHKLDVAEQRVLALGAPSQKVPALGRLAVAYNSAKQPNKSMQLLRQAVQLAQSPMVARQFALQDSLIRELVNFHLQVGRPDEASQLMALLRTSQTESLQAVITAYSEAGQTAKVNQLLSERLQVLQGNVKEWQLDLWDVLQIAAAVQRFDWIRNEWAQISAINYGPQDWQMVKLVTAYAQTGRYSQAVQWVNQLPLDNRPLLRIRLLAAIALSSHRSGATIFANDLLKQTLQAISGIDKANRAKFEREGGDLFARDSFKPQALASIALIYAQTEQAERSWQLLQQVSQLEINMSDPMSTPPTDNPFAVFLEAEQYMGALQLAQATQNQKIREGRLYSSAMELLKQNRFDLVLPVVNQLTLANNKIDLLLAIVQRYGELQQLDKALPILAQAFRAAQGIPGDESQVSRAGRDGTTEFEASNDRGSLLEAIAVKYAQFKQPAEALKVANTLQEKQTRDKALQKVKCFVNK